MGVRPPPPPYFSLLSFDCPLSLLPFILPCLSVSCVTVLPLSSFLSFCAPLRNLRLASFTSSSLCCVRVGGDVRTRVCERAFHVIFPRCRLSDFTDSRHLREELFLPLFCVSSPRPSLPLHVPWEKMAAAHAWLRVTRTREARRKWRTHTTRSLRFSAAAANSP